VAAYYDSNIRVAGLTLPQIAFDTAPLAESKSHVWHLYVIRHPERDRLQKHLMQCGVQTLIHYPTPPHKQLAYRDRFTYPLPVTEKIHAEVLSLPISPVQTQEETEIVTGALNSFC
jgi:dTDP-4-amino-4,6-dideoxygalactose transaminase